MCPYTILSHPEDWRPRGGFRSGPKQFHWIKNFKKIRQKPNKKQRLSDWTSCDLNPSVWRVSYWTLWGTIKQPSDCHLLTADIFQDITGNMTKLLMKRRTESNKETCHVQMSGFFFLLKPTFLVGFVGRASLLVLVWHHPLQGGGNSFSRPTATAGRIWALICQRIHHQTCQSQ